MQPLTLILLAALMCACRGSSDRELRTPPSTQAAPEEMQRPTRVFESARSGYRVQYPAGWTPRPSDEYELEIVADDGVATISIDVPKLPPHLPGMIRMHLIQDGLVDDVKKQFRHVQIVEERDISFPDSKGRQIHLRWQRNAQPHEQLALMLIHDGRVYIIRGTAPAPTFDRARAGFELVVGSLNWTR